MVCIRGHSWTRFTLSFDGIYETKYLWLSWVPSWQKWAKNLEHAKFLIFSIFLYARCVIVRIACYTVWYSTLFIVIHGFQNCNEHREKIRKFKYLFRIKCLYLSSLRDAKFYFRTWTQHIRLNLKSYFYFILPYTLLSNWTIVRFLLYWWL
jgi:hypothetical protein